MKERLLDVIKWGLIIIIGGCVFYSVFPKYSFRWENSNFILGEQLIPTKDLVRSNSILGKWEKFTSNGWEHISLRKSSQMPFYQCERD